MRAGRRGLVIRNWVMPARWSERHRLHVAVALLDEHDGVHTVAQELDYWPFRHDELLADLAAVGLRMQTTTYAGDVDRYLVAACRRA